jgi:hypothetical protein
MPSLKMYLQAIQYRITRGNSTGVATERDACSLLLLGIL